jgi:hypothetical protein
MTRIRRNGGICAGGRGTTTGACVGEAGSDMVGGGTEWNGRPTRGGRGLSVSGGGMMLVVAVERGGVEIGGGGGYIEGGETDGGRVVSP